MPYSNTWTTSYPQRRNSSYSPEVKSSLDVINRYIKGERLVEEVDPTSAWSVRSGIDKNRAMSVQQDRLLTSGISEQLNNIPSLGKGNNPANGNWTARKLDMPSPSLSNPNVVDPNASFRSLSPPRTGISGQPYPLINNERMRQHEDLFYHQRAVVEQSSSVQPVQTSQIDNKYHLTLVDVVDFLRWHYSSDPAAEESQLSVGNGISTLSEEDISSLTACLTEELIQMKRSSLVDASQPKLQQQASSFIPTPGLTAASSYISDDEFNKSAIITRTDTVQRTVERLPDRKQSSSSIGVQATPPVIPVVKNPQTVPELRKLYEADGVSDEGGNKQNKELVAASGIDPAVVIANKTEAPKTEAPKTEAPNKETSSEDTELDADWSSSEPEVSPSVFPAKGQVHPPSTIRSRSRSLSVGHKAAVAAPPAVGFRTPSPRTTTPAPPLTVDTKHRLTGRKVPPTGIAKTPLPSPMAVPPELRPDSHPAKITTPSGNTQPTSLPVAPPVAPPIVIATPIVGPPPEAVSRELASLFQMLQPLDVTKFHAKASLRRLGRGKRWLKVEQANQPVLLISKKARFELTDTHRWKLSALRQVTRGGVGASWNAHRSSDGQYLKGVTSEEYLSPENCFSLLFGLPNASKQFNFYCGSKDKLHTWSRYFELIALQNERARLLSR